MDILQITPNRQDEPATQVRTSTGTDARGTKGDDQKTTLYSSLYRLYLYPNSGHENVGSAAAPEWRYANQASASDDNTEGSATRSYAGVRDGKVFVNNGFWEIGRAHV